MIDFGIELGSLQWMFHQSTGIFYFPLLEAHELHHLHGIAMGIPSLSDSVFKREPVPGQLFTNQHGGPQDWVALQEGSKASESATIKLAKGENYDDPDESDELTQPPSKPIDTTPVVSGAARLRYADALWVGPQVHDDGLHDSADDGIIRVVYLDDVLLSGADQMPRAWKVPRLMVEPLWLLGSNPAYPFLRGVCSWTFWEWLVWIMMDCTAADPTGIVVSTAPVGAGRSPGSGPLGRAVRKLAA